MCYSKVKKIFQMFTSEFASRSTRKHNVRSYIRSLTLLGEKYILSKPVKLVRKEK